MELTKYQELAARTAIYPSDRGLEYTVLGLASEAGELAGVLKKFIRGDAGLAVRQRLIDELGDCLWYCAAVATELEIDLECVALLNLAKLQGRSDRGVIGGDGDER